jgi:hypothetical protein
LDSLGWSGHGDGAVAPFGLTVKVQSCVLHGCTGSVAVVAMAADTFHAPIAATCLNLLIKCHVVKIRVVNFEGFSHGQLLAGWVVDGSIIQVFPVTSTII